MNVSWGWMDISIFQNESYAGGSVFDHVNKLCPLTQLEQATTQRLQSNRQPHTFAGPMWNQNSLRRSGNAGMRGTSLPMQSFTMRGGATKDHGHQGTKYNNNTNHGADMGRTSTGGARKPMVRQPRVASTIRKPLTLSDRFGAYHQHGKGDTGTRPTRRANGNHSAQTYGKRGTGAERPYGSSTALNHDVNWRHQSNSTSKRWHGDRRGKKQNQKKGGGLQVYFNSFN